MADLNASSIIVTAPRLVDRGLREIGLTREIVRAIAIAAAGARADALAVDPSGTPGMLSYIYGTRTKRLRLLPLGWKDSRERHVESTVNHKLGVQLCFQNVDQACTSNDPQAISCKGAASRDLVKSGQPDLFDTVVRGADQTGRPPTVWLICVSVNEDSLRAEVSCPEIFEGNQFEGFVRRLFVVDESVGPQPTRRSESEDSVIDLDVLVSRK